MAISKPQPVSTDQAEHLVERWPGIRSYGQAWRHLWKLGGGKPGTVTFSLVSLGEALGSTTDSYRCGLRATRALASHRVRLAQVVTIERGWATVYLENPAAVAKDPRDVKTNLRKIDPGPQPELFRDDGDAPQLAPQLAVGYLEEEKNKDTITPNSPTATTGACCGANPLDDSEFLRTAEGLAHLWVSTSEVTYNGRKRDRVKDITRGVNASLKAGFTTEEIEAAMRQRENVLEFYTQFHERLLKERRAKQHGYASNGPIGFGALVPEVDKDADQQ